MDIDSMLAGMELDCLIADRVMGFSPYTHKGTFLDANRKIRNTNKQANLSQYWSPSTNIAHAWEVIDRLSNLDCLNPLLATDEIEEIPDGSDKSTYDVIPPGKTVLLWFEIIRFMDNQGGECVIYDGEGMDLIIAESEADTVQLAICRAALKAVLNG